MRYQILLDDHHSPIKNKCPYLVNNFEFVLPTCRCQKRNVKMSPIPIPMTQAVSINIRRRRFVNAYRQMIF